ncbi:MAG: DMT family transporter, partial [Betaproteobacteria bacterium]|nr:DMT family transporter [Betaproteobacteria bacterium]
MRDKLNLVRANLLCMLSMLVWAVALPAADLLIANVPPLPLTAARMALASACLLPLWWWLEGGAALRNAPWGRAILIGGSTIGGGAFMLVVGQGMTNAVTVALVSASMPLIAIAIEVVLDARRLTAALVVGVLLSLGGGAMAMGSGAGGVGLGLGALLCFLAVLLFTLGSRATVTAFALLTPLGRTTVTLTGAALTTCAAAGLNALLGGAAPQWALLGFNELAALALFSIGGLAISQLLWIMSVGSLGIALSSLHINATPFYVMGTLFALGGAWNWTQAWAAAVVALGVLVAQGIVRLGPAGTGSA